MSLTRRKSMRAVDRAPSIVNRPSTSPIHLMIRPDAKKLSKTTGEDARQFSSFTADGLFPHTLEENKAPRGHNDIDKELLAEHRKLERAQLASLLDVEHLELETELNRIIRLPLVDFMKIPPTTDPQTMITSTVTPASIRANSPLSQSQQMLSLIQRPQSASSNTPAAQQLSSQSNHNNFSSAAISRAVSPTSLNLLSAPSALLARPTSSASQRPASAASSYLSSWPVSAGGVNRNSTTTPPTSNTTTLVVPTTIPGSRPTTPLVYIGGRINVDCTATLSRPTSAAPAPAASTTTTPQQQPQQRLSATSLSGSLGGVNRLGRHNSGKVRLAQQPNLLEETLSPMSSAPPPPSSSSNSGGGGGGHLRLIFKGSAATQALTSVEQRSAGLAFNEDDVDDLDVSNAAMSLSLQQQHPSLYVRPSSTSSQYRFGSALVSPSASYRRASTAHGGFSSSNDQGGGVAPPPSAVNDTSILMSSSPFAHLLQRRATAANLSRSQSPAHHREGSPMSSYASASAAGSACRMVHQRHQTQTRKQHGFNISTSYISHEPDAAMYDVALSAMLRSSSRPGSAASYGDGGPVVPQQHRMVQGGKTSVAAAAAVSPLRAVFLQ
ncbi:Hypothetical protein, putative [Bodo saltans]|uniref:Uncharacterized protein n=1 Tax=Bodo saltans TaxID=75058 RepID=A0A0S4J3Q4_BODSA|nr:Hypothetical protein, putative [Bodo saltans]|eukprot:CUG70084.1 Hypothetical protein, putative [Bodo saltans]